MVSAPALARAPGLSPAASPDAAGLDDTDRRLLDALQAGFPLAAEPYAEIGRTVGIPAQEALERVRSLRRRGIIRRIGGVLNSQRLELTTTLVAAKVPADQIEAVAAVVNALPNVTHNYVRDFDYNLWFTLTAHSSDELDALLERIRRETGLAAMRSLPSLKTYKINVRMGLSS